MSATGDGGPVAATAVARGRRTLQLFTSWPTWVEAQTSADSASAAATAAEFHHALARGDSAAVLALLAPDATIMEAGGIESREEYRRHHLPAVIAFMQAAP